MSILDALRSRAFPTGNFENIKLADINNPNRMRYNIDATRDLVKNQPFNPLAPGLAFTASLPYDITQGIGRAFEGFEPQTGIVDYDVIPDAPTFVDVGRSIAAENPIDSLIGRTYGATLGLGDKLSSLGKTISDAIISPAAAPEIDNIEAVIEARKNREALNRIGLMALDDAGLISDPYETFTQVAKPGFNKQFAKQLGSTALSFITGNPVAALFAKGLGALAGRGGLTGIRGGVDLRGDTVFDTFKRSTSIANFLQRRRDQKAREAAAARGSVKELQSRIDRGDFDGGNPDDAPGGAASNQDAQRGGQYG